MFISGSVLQFSSQILFTSLLFLRVLGQHHDAHSKLNQLSAAVYNSQESSQNSSFSPFWKRDGTCSKATPCPKGDCCNKLGNCGRDPDHCGKDVCVDSCDAKAECGIGALEADFYCPINVCCSKFGYCGTTEEFCADGCQSGCLQPGPTSLGKGDVQRLVIGYWGAWSFQRRGCSRRELSDVPTGSLTHLNVAFGFMAPGSYEIYPIPGAAEKDFINLANLKHEAPGLQIWLSLGGWTYSDNGTTTQAVWGDLASTAAKRRKFIVALVKFMSSFGFDGVDLDWEYPGAPDRGGNKEDGSNLALLLKEMREYFDANNLPYGISATIPTSFWYLRWFPLDKMMKYVNWVNLMSYDIHGSWDSPESYVGSYVFAHTNLTEIDDALDLLWRNNVPANQVNLGIGFYGRSYTLSDPNCAKPGCAFESGGVAGSCTGTSGILSYQEISAVINNYELTTVYDEVAKVKYMTWDTNQWVSYDDVDTLKDKVKYANAKGLLGLLIWSIDLDDRQHTALDAVLWPTGLGKFDNQNGVGSRSTQEWNTGTDNQCDWSDCGQPCSGNTQGALKDAVQCYSGGEKKTQQLCCPLNSTPDPGQCRWSVGIIANQLGGFVCSGTCDSSEILMAENDNYKVGNQEGACFLGSTAKYCCKIGSTGSSACGFSDQCIKINSKTDMPSGSDGCPSGRSFVTYKRGSCDKGANLWQPFCCNTEVDVKKAECHWKGSYFDYCLDTNCDKGEVSIPDGSDYEGGGGSCVPSLDGINSDMAMPLQLCCNAGALAVTTKNLKIPLEWLFPKPGPSTNKESFNLRLDPTLGGVKGDGTVTSEVNDDDPNQNSFGLYLLSGPPQDVTSFDKRDGSHWELYDCPPEKHESRQTVKAICTDRSTSSNCEDIYLGDHGVAGTIVEMPPHCGPGKYAIAVSLKPAASQERPSYLVKRGLESETVYDFTFDYDYSPVTKRANADVLVRLDYSDNAGYWKAIVDKAPAGVKKRSEIEFEVHQQYGGDYRAYLEHTFKKEVHSTPHHKRDDLHARWFSSTLRDWLNTQQDIDIGYGGLRRTVTDNFRWYLFKDEVQCDVGGIPVVAKLEAYADLDIGAQASAELSIIGNLGNLRGFDQSAVRFRTKGEVKASLTLDAQARMHFTTGEVELFSAANFGAAFRIPGFVTIGPNMRVTGSIAGEATLHAKATAQLKVFSWDYAQKYGKGSQPEDVDNPDVFDPVDEPETGQEGLEFHYDLDAQGYITMHMTPIFTLGIVFDWDAIADSSVDLGIDNWVTFAASAGVGTDVAAGYCYSVQAGTELFLRVNTPTLFGVNFNRYHPLWSRNIWIIEQTCGTITTPEPSFTTSQPDALVNRRGLFAGEGLLGISEPLSFVGM